ncbi:10542_t:CDS:10 [Ambispora leptoticha]|uniref:acylaminoacyl-peptidase n=1 Tax=Ambispora leptoticha TaxID=144679 RepID=A0A9N9B9D2_9GLOM|nr:10542_t:CDS:10 [Ambispora leptoticha]
MSSAIRDNHTVRTYESFAIIPNYTEVTIIPQKTAFLTLLNLQVLLSQRDFTRKIKRKSLKSLFVSVNNDNKNISSPLSSLPVVDLGDGLIKQEISPSGEYLAVLRIIENDNKKGKKKFVEIWRKGTLLHVLDVTDDHGDFYGDSQVGSLQWSRNESQFVYIAERKAPDDPSRKFNFVNDWGEQLSNKRESAIVVVDITSLSSTSTSRNSSGGNGGFVKVLPAFEGIVPEHLSVGLEHTRSPRLNLTGDLLVFLSNKAGGPHWSCSELRLYDFKTGAHHVIVPIIHDPSKPQSTSSYPVGFPGLYIDQLPHRSSFMSIENTEFLLLHSIWRSWKTVLAVNLLNGDVHNISSSYSETLNYKSYNLFAVWNKFVVVSESAPNQLDTLILGTVNEFNSNTKNFEISWTPIDKPNDEEVTPILSDISWSVVTPYRDNPNLEMIHIKPIATTNDDNNNSSEINKQSKLPPLIVYPHGGPHSTTTTGLNPLLATLVSAGFQIVEGLFFLSLGFGQNSIETLIGQIGELEIEEVQSTAKYLIDNHQADPNQVVIIGGSHGGFISAHLIGKYPESDFYRACVLRNPVLNIGGMAFVTDIPDWCFSELSIPYKFTQPSLVLPSTYTQMFSRSPVKNIDRIKTPTLLCLGEQDLRVPHGDGLNWLYYLKGKSQENGENIDIRCKMYPETGHALDSIEAELDVAAEIIRFLGEKIEC